MGSRALVELSLPLTGSTAPAAPQSWTRTEDWPARRRRVPAGPGPPSDALYQEILDAVHTVVARLIGSGSVVSYIPRLATVDPRHFGVAIATVDDHIYGVGDWRTPFSIQSVSKVFALALAMGHTTHPIWTRVGHQPSEAPFDGLAQLECDRGIPLNPRRQRQLPRRTGRAGGLHHADHTIGGLPAAHTRGAHDDDDTTSWSAPRL